MTIFITRGVADQLFVCSTGLFWCANLALPSRMHFTGRLVWGGGGGGGVGTPYYVLFGEASKVKSNLSWASGR